MHPVLDRPFVILLALMAGVRGCFRGRPRGRFCLIRESGACICEASGAALTSSRLMSSMGSSLGTVRASPELRSQWSQRASSSASSRSAYSMLHESVQDEDAEGTVVGAEKPSTAVSMAELTGEIWPIWIGIDIEDPFHVVSVGDGDGSTIESHVPSSTGPSLLKGGQGMASPSVSSASGRCMARLQRGCLPTGTSANRSGSTSYYRWAGFISTRGTVLQEAQGPWNVQSRQVPGGFISRRPGGPCMGNSGATRSPLPPPRGCVGVGWSAGWLSTQAPAAEWSCWEPSETGDGSEDPEARSEGTRDGG